VKVKSEENDKITAPSTELERKQRENRPGSRGSTHSGEKAFPLVLTLPFFRRSPEENEREMSRPEERLWCLSSAPIRRPRDQHHLKGNKRINFSSS